MLALAGVGVEVEVNSAVKAAEAFVLVLYGVAVDDIHDYGDTALVGVVDKFFKFFGSAEAA